MFTGQWDFLLPALAKRNSNLYRTADKERLIAYMRRLNETLAKVVDDCGYH